MIAVIWLSCLLYITVTLSNPVTFNLAQILKADAICVGKFEDGSFQVEDCWPEITVDLNRFANQDAIKPEPNTRYIVPVTISGPGITPAPFGVPLIYPANDVTVDRVRAMRELR